jgi:uncharacterized metal-binding protein YceD (DUF177 family)
METLEEFKLLFSSLKDGENRFKYKLDQSFFEAFEYNEIISCNIQVELFLIKTTSLLDLKFELNGSYFTKCDKCLDKLEVLLNTNFRQLIKFIEEEVTNDEDILFIENNAYDINIAPFIFGDCLLNFPKKQIHQEGECDKESMEILNQYLLIESSDEELKNDEISDPRWEKLIALKKINNKN